MGFKIDKEIQYMYLKDQHFECFFKISHWNESDSVTELGYSQGCIIRSILPSGMGARGVSSEHMENMKMFSTEVLSGSPT